VNEIGESGYMLGSQFILRLYYAFPHQLSFYSLKRHNVYSVHTVWL